MSDLNEIKRYLVFAYNDYYPAGGWGDFHGAFGTLEEAMAFCKNDSIVLSCDGCEIVDLRKMEVADSD